MSSHPVPSGESERLEERLRQDAADVERITDTHTAMVVRPVLVKRLREAADELARLRAEAARYREALRDAWLLIQNAGPHAWDNGNTGPGGYPDEGAVLASQIMERVAPVADPLLELTTEGGDRV